MGNPVSYPALRRELAGAGVDQKQVAEHLGYVPSQITKRMRGEIPWRITELQAIADLLGVPVVTLIDEPATGSVVSS